MTPNENGPDEGQAKGPESTTAEAGRSAPAEDPRKQDLRYSVFGSDCQLYGPASEEVLGKWIAEKRVETDTWIFDGQRAVWKTASELEVFRRHRPPSGRSGTGETAFDWLRRIRAFATLDSDELSLLGPRLRKHQALTREVLIQPNIDIVTAWFIYSGSVELLMELDGQLRPVEELRTGDVFGEQALSGKYPSLYQARASEISVVYGLRQTDFHSLMGGHPQLGVKLLTAIMLDLSLRHIRARKRLATAKMLARGGLGRTGRLVVPVLKEISKSHPTHPTKGGRKRRITRRQPSAGFDPTYVDG